MATTRLALSRAIHSSWKRETVKLSGVSTISQKCNYTNGGSTTKKSLQERLSNGDGVLCAEGYLLALSRRGYIAHGVWVPEFILEQPQVLKSVHYEMAHAGSDVIEAFQYYTHREKMRQVGREGDLERINRIALQMAREVAEEKNLIFAGGISNTNVYEKDNEIKVAEMFEEQIRWAKEEGAEYMIGETFHQLGEAKLALQVIKSFNLPAVITLTPHVPRKEGGVFTTDGIEMGEACRQLLEGGATIAGVNCSYGPDMMLEIIEDIVKVCPPEKIGALPVAYRTNKQEPTFFHLTDHVCPANNPVYPRGLEPFCISPIEMTQFTQRCMELGLRYLGICCGNSGELTRTMAEAMGKTPPASKYLTTEVGLMNEILAKTEKQ